ncbi:DUF1738 domain-containing protein [Sulfitobacter pseudonitzschiae]|nr:DUF1738 domain-containing protein [Pseudosulfitobacter pseudonitzschiae]MBM1868205.1 DUF1738 domain-containing protein [Pseudosulfitobacter pseudonitzschiae]
MAKSSKPKFDIAASITNELIEIIDRGVLPWRKPWKVGGSAVPLRHSGEPYQGVNNFLLTMRTIVAGYTSPYWMTLRQANELDAKIIKGSKSSAVDADFRYGAETPDNPQTTMRVLTIMVACDW